MIEKQRKSLRDILLCFSEALPRMRTIELVSTAERENYVVAMIACFQEITMQRSKGAVWSRQFSTSEGALLNNGRGK